MKQITKTQKNKSSRKKRIFRNSVTGFINKYRPSTANVFTPVRKSTRNNSVSCSKTPSQSKNKIIPQFEMSKSPKKKIKNISTPLAKRKFVRKNTFIEKFKVKTLVTKKTVENKRNNDKENSTISYIKKLKCSNFTKLINETNIIKPQRIELIKKKNIRRKALIKQVKTINPELKLNLEAVINTEDIDSKTNLVQEFQKSQNLYQPVEINQKILLKEFDHPKQDHFDSLKSIKEVMGEDTVTTGKTSSKKMENTQIIVSVAKEINPSLSEISTPRE